MKTLDRAEMNRLFKPLACLFTREMVRVLEKFRFDAKTRRRIDRLARKCNEGQLTEAERREYECYVGTIDFIALLRLQALAVLKRKPPA